MTPVGLPIPEQPGDNNSSIILSPKQNPYDAKSLNWPVIHYSS